MGTGPTHLRVLEVEDENGVRSRCTVFIEDGLEWIRYAGQVHLVQGVLGAENEIEDVFGVRVIRTLPQRQ